MDNEICISEDLKRLHQWIYKEFRIDLSAYKSAQMNRRLTNIMERSGCTSFDEYIKLLNINTEQKDKLKNFITINVTEFFRNKELFDELENNMKNILLKHNKRLKIWSAACSIGAEPYTVAIILDKLTPNIKHTIIGTDIDTTILKSAERGQFRPEEVKNVDSDILKKYFEFNGEKYAICDEIKNRVKYKKHDLILEEYEKGFDLIICRNVVIYFTNEVKNKIYTKFYEALNPGGLLFVGATESIYNYKDFGFNKVGTFIYQKNN